VLRGNFRFVCGDRASDDAARASIPPIRWACAIRAILEVIYATGLRRLEMVNLKLFDLQLDRGLIVVRQGKGKKDRYVPIGEPATAWLQKYIAEAQECPRGSADQGH